jgi:hypothetical protein
MTGTKKALTKRTSRLAQLLCGLRGHQRLPHYEVDHVVLRCSNCGHDTPGWRTGGRSPVRRFDGDTKRHTLPNPRLTRLVHRKTA